ncbi:hypothetical protein JK159_03810 [Weissella minor]|uniref:hypothetical protein n=1 Tax=Weissella minor TaxID=1620 RepID=UPI001BB02F38|nr:hypothetical protein [Weissella minor]MBS0949504.1 hypothetical protein [Weissella minor]
MTDYTEKEAKVIDNIAKTLEQLDTNLANLESNEMDAKQHSFKEWIEERKAIHEIKHIMSEIGKYAKYDEKSALADEKELEEFVTKLDSQN